MKKLWLVSFWYSQKSISINIFTRHLFELQSSLTINIWYLIIYIDLKKLWLVSFGMVKNRFDKDFYLSSL